MDRELQKKYKKLRRHHDSLVGAIETLNASLNHLNAENEILKSQLVNADKVVAIQKKVVIDNLQQSRESEVRLVQEIKALKKKIKFMKEH